MRVTAPDTPVPFSPPLEEAFLPNVGEGSGEGSLAVSLLSWRSRLLGRRLPGRRGRCRDRRGRWCWKTRAAPRRVRAGRFRDHPGAGRFRRGAIAWWILIWSAPVSCCTGAESARARSSPTSRSQPDQRLSTGWSRRRFATAIARCPWWQGSGVLGTRSRLARSRRGDARTALPITGTIRAAFQMVEPTHGLQKRGEIVRSFPVQAIALGKRSHDSGVERRGGDAGRRESARADFRAVL